jgi:hypothetical protein
LSASVAHFPVSESKVDKEILAEANGEGTVPDIPGEQLGVGEGNHAAEPRKNQQRREFRRKLPI